MNRSIAPNYTQPTSLSIQFPKEIILENGIRLFWNNDVKDDSIKLDIEWEAGSKYQDQKLVANLTNRLLLSGNDQKSAKDIAEEMDYYGGFIRHEMDKDHAGVTLYGLKDNIADVFGVFSDAFLTCNFPEKEFEKERTVALSGFKIDTQKVKSICRRRFNQAVFGIDCQYGHIAIESDFEKVKQEQLVEFYNSFYIDNQPIIFLVGRVEDSFIDQLRAWTGKLSSNKPNFELSNLQQEKGRIDIPVKNAIQTAIRLGRVMFDKNHSDYFKFQLLDTLFGGYFGSRLMSNIREDKGYTYGINSGLSVMQDTAYFFITTEVAVEVKEETIKEIYAEMDRLKTELIPADELTKVKNYMLGDFLRHADGSIAMMENFKNIHFNQLKPTYYTDFIQAINEATAEELRDLAIKYFQPEELILVTAG